MTARFTHPGPKFQQPSYYGLPSLDATIQGADRRKRRIAVAVERRSGLLRRWADRVAAGKGA